MPRLNFTPGMPVKKPEAARDGASVNGEGMPPPYAAGDPVPFRAAGERYTPAFNTQTAAPAGVASEETKERIPIGDEQLAKAVNILQRYKRGKSNLERKTIENEQFWKLRHWRSSYAPNLRNGDYTPASAWLWSAIVSKHADMMDGMPEPNIRPKERGDVEEAKRLSEVVPVILENCDFETVYSEVSWYKLKQGTGVYGVFWDKSAAQGLGDIAVKKVDLLNLFWQPGISDIQDSPNLFHVTLQDNDALEELYPNLSGKLSTPTVKVAEYIYDDTVETSDKSAVIDWYYKRHESGKTVLHYCKFVNGVVLYSTENNGMPGLYDHARYPFVFDVLYSIEGSPAGYGVTDINKETQVQIDALSEAVTKNALMAARRRYFVRSDGAVNEEEFADWQREFVHVDGNLGEDSIREMTPNGLSGSYVEILNAKIDELKETSGNRDTANGGTSSGVTAASAIAAMQEQAGKTSRDLLKQTYKAYKDIVWFCIELIRQFYDLPRQFRIVGETGQEEYAQYSNEGLQPRAAGEFMGQPTEYTTPSFDIEVSASKANPYSKMSQNELMLQLYSQGFFAPDNADQALACLECMDFQHKSDLTDRIKENQTLMQTAQQMSGELMQLADQVDAMDPAAQAHNRLLQEYPQYYEGVPQTQTPAPGVEPEVPQTDILGTVKPEEHWRVQRARQQSQESTQPR